MNARATRSDLAERVRAAETRLAKAIADRHDGSGSSTHVLKAGRALKKLVKQQARMVEAARKPRRRPSSAAAPKAASGDA